MTEYIEREALLTDIEESVVFSGRQSRNAEILGANKIIDRIKVAPMVDAVPVVRCKECIRRYDTDECPMCYVSEGQYYEYTSSNGFCDKGERRINETN